MVGDNLSGKLSFLARFAKKTIVGDGEGTTLYEKMKDKFKDRVDEKLVLGIKIDSLIDLDIENDAMLGEESFLFPDLSGKSQIIAFGTIKISDNLKITRFYAKTLANPETIFIIEVGENNKEVEIIKLYAMYDELYLTDEDCPAPVTDNGEAVLKHWIGNTNPLIGAPEFRITKDKKDFIYQNIGGKTSVEKESIFDLPKDEDIDYEKHTVAYYSRKLEGELSYDGAELCMLRLTETADAASVQIYIGVEISKTKIKVMG